MKIQKYIIGLVLTVLLLGISTWEGLAQEFSKDRWHEGQIDLFTGETLKGMLRYDLENNNLQLQQSNTIKSFSAYQVEFFQFFDVLQKTIRTFYTLPYVKVGTYESPHFFELFAEGYLCLLSREVVSFRYASPMGMWGWGFRPLATASIPVLEDSYYILLRKDEKVVKMDDKKQLLSLMQDKSREVEDFIQTNRIRLERREDLIRLFDYYNSFKPKE